MNRDQNYKRHSPFGAAMSALMFISREHFKKPIGHVPTVSKSTPADEHTLHFGVGGPGFTPKEVGGLYAL